MSITREVLHEKIKSCGNQSIDKKKDFVMKFLIDLFCLSANEVSVGNLKDCIREQFFSAYFRFWKSCNRTETRFRAKYGNWLKKKIVFPATLRKGRPKKNFESSSDVVKRRRTENIRKTATTAELTFATSMKLREDGKSAEAALLKEATTTTPNRAKRILKKMEIDATSTNTNDCRGSSKLTNFTST